MTREAYFIPRLPLREYLADRSRTSGHVLSMVEREPERYGRWLAGTDVDRQSAAMGRGAYFHARLMEPDEVAGSFAFYPSRNEAMEDEKVIPEGQKTAKKTGRLVPQDASPAGRNKSMMTKSARGKQAHREFLESAKGLTIVYPEDQPVVEAMLRAVNRHEHASALLTPDGFAPEVTIHWTCEETGELLQARPDGMRLQERTWIELKSIVVKNEDERLDTLDSHAVGRWARDGWARKSALVHDGCRAVTGDSWTGYWIVVEALTVEQLERGWEPRVSVVRDDVEVDDRPCLYTLGRLGGGGVRGYVDLVRAAQALREEKDFRHDCVREVVPGWSLPGWLINDMMLEAAQRNPVVIKGARKMEAAHG